MAGATGSHRGRWPEDRHYRTLALETDFCAAYLWIDKRLFIERYSLNALRMMPLLRRWPDRNGYELGTAKTERKRRLVTNLVESCECQLCSAGREALDMAHCGDHGEADLEVWILI